MYNAMFNYAYIIYVCKVIMVASTEKCHQWFISLVMVLLIVKVWEIAEPCLGYLAWSSDTEGTSPEPYGTHQQRPQTFSPWGSWTQACSLEGEGRWLTIVGYNNNPPPPPNQPLQPLLRLINSHGCGRSGQLGYAMAMIITHWWHNLRTKNMLEILFLVQAPKAAWVREAIPDTVSLATEDSIQQWNCTWTIDLQTTEDLTGSLAM